MDAKPYLDCPTGILIDFNSSDSSKGDFSMSDILHLSDIPDSYNMSALFETTRHNTHSESSAGGSSLKLSESDAEIAEFFPEDDIRNETFDFELPDILEESESIINAAASQIASSRTQFISLNDQEQWNAEIMMEANKISRRLSLSSLSSNDRNDSRSTYILRSSNAQSSVDDDFVFDSPIKFTLTPRKTARPSSSDKENDPLRANRRSQLKTPRSSKKYNSPASVSSNDSVFSDKEIKTEELSELESKVAKLPELLVEIQSEANEIKYKSSPEHSSNKILGNIENVNVTKLAEDKPIRKGTYNLDTDEEEALISANIEIPFIEPLLIRRETYSRDNDETELLLENLKRTRHASGPSNLTPSAIEKEMIPVRSLIKSKSSIGFVKPKPLDRTIRSNVTTSKVAQPSSFLRKPAIPPQTKPSLKTSRISTYGARPKPTSTVTSVNVKSTKPTATTSVASKLKMTGPVKAQQRFSNLPKVETEIKPRSRMNTSLQLPSESTKRSIPSPMMNPRRSLTPQPSPVTIRTPSRISLVPTEFAVPLTPRRMSMLPSRSTPGRQTFATSSPLTPGLKRGQSIAGVPEGSKASFSRLPSPMRRK